MTQQPKQLKASNPVPEAERDWLESDLANLDKYDPYDWGDLDPQTLGKPLIYVPDLGFVVEGDKDNA
ncbi:MAG: hypothetical protein F6K45_14445 [Kamptonema sp. SIO1D9]|nr:hypothetical protein [Kamptonema sp. SIO1D9]